MKFRKSFLHALKILGASMLPLIAAYIAVWVEDQKYMTLKEITGQGEMIIICIPIAVSIIFSLYDYKTEKNNKNSFTWPNLVFYITIFWACISVFIYAKDFNEVISPTKNLTIYSLTFFVWTFIAIIVDKYNLEVFEDIANSRSDDVDKLEKKFNKVKSG